VEVVIDGISSENLQVPSRKETAMFASQLNIRSLLAKAVAPFLPEWAHALHVSRRIHKIRDRFRSKTLKDTFSTIYRENGWGGRAGEYSSGSGSAAAYAVEYCRRINEFVDVRELRSVVDLGCGDFQVGKQLARPGISYVGVDIVEELVHHHVQTYGAEGIRFECLDVTRDPLPRAELCLIRQVLQHLSNAEIFGVLRNCCDYPFIIVTEHVPSGIIQFPNRDKPHGPDIRLYEGSGVCLNQPPFNFAIQRLFDVPYIGRLGGVLRTELVTGSEVRKNILMAAT
jgi:SAM-dependent methyltransferase